MRARLDVDTSWDGLADAHHIVLHIDEFEFDEHHESNPLM